MRQNGVPGSIVGGPGQHLSLRGPEQRGEAIDGQGTTNAIWPGDGATGGGTHFGQQPASQGAGGTDEWRYCRIGWSRRCGWQASTIWKRRIGFWRTMYLGEFNRRFGRVAASARDVHRDVPRNLNEMLSWEEQRVVQRDWTVACEGKWYQLDRQHEALSLAGRKVVIRTLRDGQVQLVYRGRKLNWKELPARPARVQPGEPGKSVRAIKTPAANHPWRRPLWRAGRAAQLGAGILGQPPRRSGSPHPTTPSRRNKEARSANKKGTFSLKL